ncbi:TonB-dependent receptor plug domain-containing protein [Holophaga foetida]|uniref:TonB-dependent receptor plug domain-containing protein n=1 Tax=Holophaga foetida TaxID=35839 RepID=UPI0002472139|nr:TonB-dependent receptor [Holophaga foetida]
MHRTFRPYAVIWLAGAILAASGSLDDRAEEGGIGRRSGPRYSSHLAKLPIGTFVETLSLDQLAEVIVTDTKSAQRQESVTQKVLIVYSEAFDQSTASNRNLAELVKYQPGQFVNVLSRNDANWGSFGGLGPKYNTYLLDGLPMDSFMDAMSLDPWAFDRIEVQQGPAAVMYSNYLSMDFAGNESPLAGTTHFVLKERIDGPLTRIQASGGSYATMGGKIYHQDQKGAFSYLAGASHEQSNYTNYGTTPSWLNILEDPRYKKSKVYGKVTYALGEADHRLSIFLHHTAHTGQVGRPNRDFQHLYDTLNLTYSRPIRESIHLQAKAGYRGYDRNWSEDNYPTNLERKERDRVKQRIVPADVTLTWKHWGESLLSVGADAQFATYTSYSDASGSTRISNDARAQSLGVFLQEKLVSWKWVWRAGARFNRTSHHYDWIGGTRPEVSRKAWNRSLWSAGTRFNATPVFSFFGNISSSFLAPSAKSVGGTLQEGDVGQPGKDGQLPNRNLSPEKGIGMDLGMNVQPGHALTLSLRGFFTRVNDAIVDNVVSSTPSQTRSVNAGRASSLGLELSAEQVVSDKCIWFSNLTLTRSELRNAVDLDQDGADTPFAPRYVANLGLTLGLPKGLTVSPCLQSFGRYFDSSSKSSRAAFGNDQILNIKAQASLYRSSSHALSCALDLNNVLDRKIRMPWQFQDPGFNATFHIHLSF